MKNKFREINWRKDIFAGVVVALVSIPISMGYAQIAGLPPVYGLYGSILPILIYGLLTSSKQFIVGVDAMPAAMVGGILARLGIASQSEEAMMLVPVTALLVAAWFMILYFLRAGRIVKYVSVPVMGGFISGVGATIILMQIPKLFGGSPGTGEMPKLLLNIWEQRKLFHPLSFTLGIASIIMILFCKKWIPKLPMTVIMMALGAIVQAFLHLDRYGVAVMSEVPSGFPKLILPGFEQKAGALPKFVLLQTDAFAGYVPGLLIDTLGIAAVIMAQTLLASGNYARKAGETLDNDQELLAYGAMNLAGAVIGCCPVNGSVSRSGIADSLGIKSQMASIVASFTMLMVLLFGTPFLRFLPIPVLTGIVITALIGILEIKMVKKLWKTGKNEWLVFLLAFFGVLFFGTLYGVIIGVLLSFWEVAMRATMPPTAFVGRIPGHGNFYSLKRNSAARPIKHTVIYRFGGNLFFANIDLFCDQIESGIKEDTHQVVVDARGIGTVDVTAVERLILLYQDLKKRGIYFYLTEHDGALNDLLRRRGGEILIEEGAVRRTITLALRDAGVERPYELEEVEKASLASAITDSSDDQIDAGTESDDRLSEFEWVFGSEAQERMQQLANDMAEKIVNAAGREEMEAQLLKEEGIRTEWGLLGRFDEDEFWDFCELRLEELVSEGRMEKAFADKLERHIEKRRQFGQQKLKEMNPHAAKLLSRHGEVIRNYIKQKHPEEYERYLQMQKSLKGNNNNNNSSSSNREDH